MSATTRCPRCFDGVVYARCERCEGRGTDGDGSDCRACGGAGEVRLPDACSTCAGVGVLRRGRARVIEADRWCRGFDGGAPRFDLVRHVISPSERARQQAAGRLVYEQRHGGATMWALGAWAQFRETEARSPVVGVRATVNWYVVFGDASDCRHLRVEQDRTGWLCRDCGGDATAAVSGRPRELREAALVVETVRNALVLTGCSWGYRGEGPNGTASILDDLEAFADYDAALDFVARHAQGAEWEWSA